MTTVLANMKPVCQVSCSVDVIDLAVHSFLVCLSINNLYDYLDLFSYLFECGMPWKIKIYGGTCNTCISY